VSEDCKLKHDDSSIPSDDEIDFVVQNLLPVCDGRERGSRIGADPAIVIRQLCVVLNNTVVELDDVGIL